MKRPTMGSLTLTALPDIAIDEILTRLPIKDAVRTSVLSLAWRRRWQSIPALNLWGLPPNIVSQLLLRHSSPVKSFHFGPLLKNNKNKKDEPCPIYCWLSALSHRSASTLLSLTVIFEGPLSINSLAGYLPNLTNLHLSCQLSISPHCFSGIPNLRTLHLEYFCSNLSVLVSQFPLLEKLIVKNIYNIMADEEEGENSDEEEGENSNIVEEPGSDIAAPNLRWLELFNLELNIFTITNAPLLETLIIARCHHELGTFSLLLEAPAGAPRIKRLEVDAMCIAVWARNVKQDAEGKMPMRIPVVMENLRVMSLSVLFMSKKQIALALCLLRSTPTVEELEIRGCYSVSKEYRAGKEFWVAQKHVDVFDRLRRVKMTGIQGIISELDFIHFVLAKAQTLKTMMVTFSPDIKRFKTKEWLMTKLLGFPRASNQARILLTDEAEAEELEEWG